MGSTFAKVARLAAVCDLMRKLAGCVPVTHAAICSPTFRSSLYVMSARAAITAHAPVDTECLCKAGRSYAISPLTISNFVFSAARNWKRCVYVVYDILSFDCSDI